MVKTKWPPLFGNHLVLTIQKPDEKVWFSDGWD
jgi:hypothetical protein